jgi:hypothetical protein
MIKSVTSYESIWMEHVLTEMRMKNIYEKIQLMDSSLFELDMEKMITEFERNVLSECILKENEAINAWEEIFINDNEVCFNDRTWRKFSKLKPKVNYGNG